MNLYRRVIGYYRPYLGTITSSLILMVIGVNFSLLKYWPIQWVIDHVLLAPRPDGRVHYDNLNFSTGEAALLAGLAIVVIYLMAGLLGFWRNYISIEIGLKA